MPYLGMQIRKWLVGLDCYWQTACGFAEDRVSSACPGQPRITKCANPNRTARPAVCPIPYRGHALLRGESNQSCALVSDLSVTHKSVVILNLRRISIVFSGFTAKNVF